MERIIRNTLTNLFHLHFSFYIDTSMTYDFKKWYIYKTKRALSISIKQQASSFKSIFSFLAINKILVHLTNKGILDSMKYKRHLQSLDKHMPTFCGKPGYLRCLSLDQSTVPGNKLESGGSEQHILSEAAATGRCGGAGVQDTGLWRPMIFFVNGLTFATGYKDITKRKCKP